MQYIVWHQQRLALTELELVMLVLASLNVVTFAIWWHKPLGVQEPVKIYVKTEVRKIKDAARRASVVDRSLDLSFGDVVSRGWGLLKELAPVTVGVWVLLLCCRVGPINALIYLFVGIPSILIHIISFPFFVLFPLGIVQKWVWRCAN